MEFPKSGITWLSTLLANMALLASGRDDTATFASVQHYIPDIHVTRDIGDVPYAHPMVRFIKSHSEYNKYYPTIIYLARNPIDVMKSYYKHLRELGVEVGQIDEFCRSPTTGIPAWKRHVSSWLQNNLCEQRLHLMLYADLMHDAFSEIRSVCNNFGWAIDDGIIAESVRRSSVEHMRQSEETYRQRDPRYTMQFVRGANDAELQINTIDYIMQECAKELKILGIH